MGTETKPKGLIIGVGESDHTVLKDASIANSNIGHIGDQIDVTNGGKVMTAGAVAAEAKLSQAKREDTVDRIKGVFKDLAVPCRKLYAGYGKYMDKITGIKRESASKFDKVTNEILSADATGKSDIEMSK